MTHSRHSIIRMGIALWVGLFAPIAVHAQFLSKTVLGGSASDEILGAASTATSYWVCGRTLSPDFPGRPSSTSVTNSDAFIAEVSPTGAVRRTITFGGSDLDEATGIAVDPSGYIWVVGNTRSTDLPVVNAHQPAYAGTVYDGDAFVARLAPNGSITMLTYLGGRGIDEARAVAVDPSGGAIIVGTTWSSGFPLVNAWQNWYSANADAFIVRMSAAGAITFSTYAGSTGQDGFNSVAVGPDGRYAVGGTTSSPTAPTLDSPQWMYGGGSSDGFWLVFSATNQLLQYSFAGGASTDSIRGVAYDTLGRLVIVGSSSSWTFPEDCPIKTLLVSKSGVFILRLGASVEFWQLDGSADDFALAVTTDINNTIWLCGQTASNDFPGTGAGHPAGVHGFVASVADGVITSDVLRGNKDEQMNAIASNSAARVLVAGRTRSTAYDAEPSPLPGRQAGFIALAGEAPVSEIRVAATVRGYDLAARGGAVVNVEIRRPGLSPVMTEQQLAANGQLTMSLDFVGPFDAAFQMPKGLRKTVTGLQADGAPVVVPLALVYGDPDGDNAVTLFDFLILDAWFGVSNPPVDLDGDDIVTLFDYLVVDSVFAERGDL